MERDKDGNPWVPFRAEELQLVLGVYGFLATLLVFLGLEPRVLALGSLGYVLFAYTAGLLVHARQSAHVLEFLCEGAVGGQGYLASFRSVRRCLFLIHLDDDSPGQELLGLYRSLLGRGVEIRRIVFLRTDASVGAYEWIVRFGDHAHLKQRVVLPEQAAAMRTGFVVVDDQVVLLSVPGAEAIDGAPYSSGLLLRHLLRIREPEVAAVFLKVHEDLWGRAHPLVEVAELADVGAFLARCRRGSGAGG